MPGSSATVGLNSFWGTAGDPYGSPVVPLGLPGATPTTTEDVQQILGPGLEINGAPAIPGYGYDRFESWSGQGIADIEAGARYQYFKNERWQHAFTGAVRFPTGRKDDPDNLTDFAFGQNSYALLFRSNHDFLGYKDWLFNATLKYDWVLPKEETRRIPAAVDTPITSNKEKVDINIGNRVELDLTAKYSFSPEWSVAARYRASKKWKDDVDGNMGFQYSSLEDESDRTSQIYQLYLIYSWLDKYIRTGQGFPVEAAISYRDRFAGKNALASRYFEGRVRLYF